MYVWKVGAYFMYVSQISRVVIRPIVFVIRSSKRADMSKHRRVQQRRYIIRKRE